MIDDTIQKIEAQLQSAEAIPDARRRELLELLAKLKTEVATLSQTHGEAAQSIAGFTQVSTHEATRETPNPELLGLSLRRLEPGEPEVLPIELEAVPQDVERALVVEFLGQRPDKQRFEPISVQRPHLTEEPRLRFLQASEDPGRKERPLDVPLRDVPGSPSRTLKQDRLDIGLEGMLGSLAHAIDSLPARKDFTSSSNARKADTWRSGV
jgi:hypothetical protein